MDSRIDAIKEYAKDESVLERFSKFFDNDVSKATRFIESIVSACNSNELILQCTPMSIFSAGIVAATLGLSVSPSLGQAHIVPYKTKGVMKAQFQIGYKGLIQLAVRSCNIERIWVSEVYKDEIKGWNPISGCLIETPIEERKMRKTGDEKDIEGYYAFFSTKDFYRQEMFLYKYEIEKHASKYSVSYRNGVGVWKDNFQAMAKKTVLKRLLDPWAPLSPDLKKAVDFDQSVVTVEEDGTLNVEYVDNDKQTSNKKGALPFNGGKCITDEASFTSKAIVGSFANDNVREGAA